MAANAIPVLGRQFALSLQEGDDVKQYIVNTLPGVLSTGCMCVFCVVGGAFLPVLC